MNPHHTPASVPTSALPTAGTALAFGAAALAAALLSGCVNLAPGYNQPALAVAPALDNAPIATSDGAATASGAFAVPGQADFVKDARLRQLIDLALENNRDLRAASLAIERSRALYRIERSALLPSVGATASGSRSRTSADLSSNGQSSVNSQYSVQIGLTSYEIDFFGRVRNLSDSALQTFFQVGENRRSTQISLVAEVASAWLTWDADGRRLQLARDTLRSQQASYDLTQRSYALGAISGLTLAQTQTTVDAARADVAAFVAQAARDRNALALLLGTSVPAALVPDGARPVAGPADAPPLPATQLLPVPAQLPSSVLLARPDVMAAEFSLRATYADIGAARAAFFPSISLTGSVGTASGALPGLFDGGTGTWSLTPQIRLPIFDGGRNRAALQVAEADRSIALARYDQTIQTAFREVADTLAERETLGERLAAQQSLRDATARTLELSQARYRSGADSFFQVLDAQRSLYGAQQTLIGLQLTEQLNRVTLYKVLGGEPVDGAVPAEATKLLSTK